MNLSAVVKGALVLVSFASAAALGTELVRAEQERVSAPAPERAVTASPLLDAPREAARLLLEAEPHRSVWACPISEVDDEPQPASPGAEQPTAEYLEFRAQFEAEHGPTVPLGPDARVHVCPPLPGETGPADTAKPPRAASNAKAESRKRHQEDQLGEYVRDAFGIADPDNPVGTSEISRKCQLR